MDQSTEGGYPLPRVVDTALSGLRWTENGIN